MIVAGLAAGYLTIGAVAAAWAWPRLTVGDVVALALLWPIYGPIVLERGPRDRRREMLEAALGRAHAVGAGPAPGCGPRWLARVGRATAALAALDDVLARHAGAAGAALDEARADRERRRRALAAIDRQLAAVATQLELAPWVAGGDAELARLLAELAAGVEDLEQGGNNPVDSDVVR